MLNLVATAFDRAQRPNLLPSFFLGRVSWDEFERFLSESHIIFPKEEISTFKLWIANQGFLTLDPQNTNLREVFVKAIDYADYLTEFYKNNLFEAVGDKAPADLDEALLYFQRQVYSCYLKKIEQVLSNNHLHK